MERAQHQAGCISPSEKLSEILHYFQTMNISVIIPTYNEAAHIGRLIQRLKEAGHPAVTEIIVVDGGSRDETTHKSLEAGATLAVVAPRRGRPAQMNHGARLAKGDLFYFVHADALPPVSYATDILEAVAAGYAMGRYRFRFDSPKFLLKINGWFTRFDKLWVSGGDETLFVTRAVFERLQGYNEKFIIMEEYDFVVRARQTENYVVIQKDVLVSARKYEHNSWLRVQIANFIAFRMFRKGLSPTLISERYHQLIKHPKAD